MLRNRLAVAVLVLLGLTVAISEQTLIHTDDGCAVETHCNACLLKLRTSGVVTATFTPTPMLAAADEPAAEPLPAHDEAPTRAAPSRGPPRA